MAHLRPYPFAALVRRALRELGRGGDVFDLPRAALYRPAPGLDLSVAFHGHRAATPLGPAAGPQSQMAQNLALCWLTGSRIFELKTVQVKDDLQIPRPCIDMATVGYNVEWSQELRLPESLAEYVKGRMLIEVMRERLGLDRAADPLVFDLSVGYDLAGLRSEPVQGFLRGMRDPTRLVDALRREIPAEWARYRDLDFPAAISDTVTLSTFHGCPPEEIERMILFLLEQGFHAVVKLNPMLLGPARTRELLHDVMGYADLRVPDTAFERDTRWEQMAGFVDRLGRRAAELGRGFGVKFSNTLIVENHRAFFPAAEKEMYLSGPPLFVLATNLVQRFRAEFGARFPISYSAGIDRGNFADAVALGLVPVTVCSDLLKPRGYARATGYLEALAERMRGVGATHVGDFVIRAFGHGAEALDRVPGLEPAERERALAALASGGDLRAAVGEAAHGAWRDQAALLNTDDYVPRATRDPRYAATAHAKPPRKLGSPLALFDCVTCHKCVPVCPNDANFAFVLPKLEQPIVKLRARAGGGFEAREEGRLAIARKAQYANFADFCNECGNCDVFCPEDGGPYLVKPRFFGAVADWRAQQALDGFALDPASGTLHGRVSGREYALAPAGERERYSGRGFSLLLDPADPAADPRGEAAVEVDLAPYHILRWIRAGVYASGQANYLTELAEVGGRG
ncbi:MAG: glutamate synthase [Vicinamibacteria bacterium]|nr:glutamate synthase [Vicinamibacteria bacterium]